MIIASVVGVVQMLINAYAFGLISRWDSSRLS